MAKNDFGHSFFFFSDMTMIMVTPFGKKKIRKAIAVIMTADEKYKRFKILQYH